jgi:hypothetical protein
MSLELRAVVLAGITAFLFVLSAPPAEARTRRHGHTRARVTTQLHVVITPGRQPGHIVHISGRPAGAIDFDIEPEESAVFVNGIYRGIADDLDGFPTKLSLPAGRYEITVRTPSGIVWSEMMRVLPGREINLNTRLED